MLRKMISAVLLIALIFCLASCGNRSVSRVLKNTGIDLAGCTLVKEEYVKNGDLFESDDVVIVFDCSGKKEEVLAKINGWEKITAYKDLPAAVRGSIYENSLDAPKEGYYHRELLSVSEIFEIYDTERDDFIYIEYGNKDVFARDPRNKTDIEKQLGIDLDGCEMIDNIETHGGFLGDGDTLVIFDCGEQNETILKQINESKWQAFPLPYDIDKISFPEPYNDLPEMIGDGYYYFRNRHSEAKSKDDTDIFVPNSQNFTIAVYDVDEHILYFYENDT